MNPEQPARIIKYKKPPIVERVASVVGDIALETFYAKFDSWKETIQPHFPEYDPIKDWNLNIGMKEGVPVFTDAPAEVRVTHRFWRHNANGQRFMSMRILPNQLTLNLHRENANPHHFEELRAELANWLPQWLTHFGVKGCSSVSLDYINVISTANTPQFIQNDGAIQVGRALTVFAGIPSRYHSITQPYDCQMGLIIDPIRPATFALRVIGTLLPPPFNNAVRVDFRAEVGKDKPSLNMVQVLSEADYLHTIIIEQFEAIFTPEAKTTFEPI